MEPIRTSEPTTNGEIRKTWSLVGPISDWEIRECRDTILKGLQDSRPSRLSIYGIRGRAIACWHWLRGHDVRWSFVISSRAHAFCPGDVCPGNIRCETCDEFIWCRFYG